MFGIAEEAYAFAQFQEYLVQGCVDLLRHYGLSVEHTLGAAAADVGGEAVMAVIGYAAPTVRGALLLFTSRELVTELEPREIRKDAPSDVFLRDVLGEFCNMTIGRVTRRLAGHHVAPLISTPTTISGSDLRLPAPTSGMSAWHRFASARGDLFARLDAAFEPSFQLLPADDSASASGLEGGMVIFAE